MGIFIYNFESNHILECELKNILHSFRNTVTEEAMKSKYLKRGMKSESMVREAGGADSFMESTIHT